jgi:hypothetical protein
VQVTDFIISLMVTLLCLPASTFADNGLAEEITKILAEEGLTGVAWTLVTAGLLHLDDRAAQYLPGIEFNNPWRDAAPVTVRHLLDHTSGLEDARLWQMFSERPEPDTPLAQAYPNPDKLLRIRTRPGSRFSYSNMGYGLLGSSLPLPAILALCRVF